MESEPTEKEDKTVKNIINNMYNKEEEEEKDNNKIINEEDLIFISIDDIIKDEIKITEIFKKYQNKLVESKLNLFLHPKNYIYQSIGYKDLFIYENVYPLKEKKEYTFIYDCLNFICYEKKDYTNSKNKQYYAKTINELFLMLKDKGILLILLDKYHLGYFFQILMIVLGNNYKTKLFINFYFIDTINYLFLAVIQKISKSENPIILKDLKILITDYLSNLNSKMYGSSTLGEFYNFLKNPILDMQKYNLQNQLNCSRLNTLHPGEFFQMKLKSSPLNEQISYTITIHDNSLNTEKTNKKCVAIVLGYEITQDLIFAKSFSFDNMCQQLNVGRLIIIESEILNPTGIKELAIELGDIIQYMRPNGNNEQITIKVWDDQNPKLLIYEDDKYLVRDNEDKLFTLRQLFYINNKYMENMVQSKIRIKYASKSKINNKSKINYPIETPDKLKNKGVIQCIDELNIFGFYEKCLICMAFFMDLDKLPRNTIKIMDIGAGTGVLSFYFYKLFKGCCEIDNIEINKSIYDIGVKYFGLRNYDIHKNRVNWFFEDVENVLDKMTNSNHKEAQVQKVENKYEDKFHFYDLIFNEINDIKPKEDTTPPKNNFSDEFLNKIKKLMKPCGIYMVNIMSKTYKGLYDNYLQLEKHFPSGFAIPSQSGLCSIFFCFNDKYDEEKYNKQFQKNKEIIEKNKIVEFDIVKPVLNDVMSRVREMGDLKEKLKENVKNNQISK